MKTLLKYALLISLFLPFTSCIDEKSALTEVIEDAWDEIEDDIKESAEETLEELAENPEILYKGDCETDYIPLGHIFTLLIPIDYSSQLVAGLLFGSDAAEFVSLMESASRNSKSKSEVRNLILKHFNPSWAGMITALIILDGEFDYDFEDDSWTDASYEFDAKSLYKILNEKGYFNGAYGETLPADAPAGSNASGTLTQGDTSLPVRMNL